MAFRICEISYENNGRKRDDVYSQVYANKIDAIRKVFHWMESDQHWLNSHTVNNFVRYEVMTNAYYIIEVSDV